MSVVSMSRATEKRAGRVITFYSYKGGTGRSMALANVAWMLALNGARVLVIDWDLEAPGIHRYFHPFLGDKELKSTPGLIDMVETLASLAASSSEPLSRDHVDIIDYVEPLEWPDNAQGLSWSQFGERAGIDLMPAGRQGPAYSRKLSAFNWIDFYERLDGRRLLGVAREQMCEIYDYVLIDSRTGVSDTSGICTIEMPELLVICFTLNEQSIKGASAIADSVLEAKEAAKRAGVSSGEGRPAPRRPGPTWILPVPTRVEITAEREKREVALEMAGTTFERLLKHLSADEQRKHWGGVQMAYFPFYAFEEIPAIFGDKPDELLSLTTAIKQLTRAISEPPIETLPPLHTDHQVAERIRKEIVGWYLRPVRRQPEPVRLAQQLFDGLDEAGRDVMRRLVLRLVEPGVMQGQTARSASWSELSEAERGMAERLVEPGLLAKAEISQQLLVSFREAGVVQQWAALGEWVEADRRFLVWRATIAGAADRWIRSSHDEGALLRGKLLEEVDAWLPRRRDDLSQPEREFIRASRAKAEEEAKAQEERAAAASAAAQRVEDLEERLRRDPVPAPAAASGITPRLRLVVGASTAVIVLIAAGSIYTLKSSFSQNAQLRERLEQIELSSKTATPTVPSPLAPSCPDVQKIELPSTTLRTTFTRLQSQGLDRECVLQTAMRFTDRREVTSEMFVPFILWANGLGINPHTCDRDCLQRGLKKVKEPQPGDVAIGQNGEVAFFVGGDRYLIKPPSSPTRAGPVRLFLQVPYDDLVKAP